MTNEKDTS